MATSGDPLADVVTLLQPAAPFSKLLTGAGGWAIRRTLRSNVCCRGAANRRGLNVCPLSGNETRLINVPCLGATRALARSAEGPRTTPTPR